MKKRMLTGAFVSILTLIGIFYACKKTNEPTVSPTRLVSSTQSAQRSEGTIRYYSKDTVGTVYEMILTTDADGIVTVDRSVYETDRPDTFNVRVYVGEDVSFTGFTFNPDSNKYYGDTVRVLIPSGKTYYVIPFIPGINPLARPDGDGGADITCYCQCGCFPSILCDWCLPNGDGEYLECVSLCAYCYSVSDGCPGPISTGKAGRVGGFAIIDANGVNVVN